MIGKPSGIQLAVTFGPFACVPQKAWENFKRAVFAAAEINGLPINIKEVDSPEESYRRWFAWLAEQNAKAE